MNHSRSVWSAATVAALALLLSPGVGAQGKGNDLDQFMAQVLARRDDNWKKLQQYVLDERETADFLGPGRARLFALEREYTSYIRDGVFVRSPVRFDGVTLSETDRRDAEQDWIASHREKEKEKDKDKAPGTASVSADADGHADGYRRGDGHDHAGDTRARLRVRRLFPAAQL